MPQLMLTSGVIRNRGEPPPCSITADPMTSGRWLPGEAGRRVGEADLSRQAGPPPMAAPISRATVAAGPGPSEARPAIAPAMS